MMISSNRRRRNFSWSTALVILLVGLIIFLVWLFRHGTGEIFWSIAKPILTVRNALTLSQVDVLRAELAQVGARAADRDMLYAENQTLKALLNRTEGHEVVLATILLRPPGTPYDTLLIDRGSRDGVTEGNRVSAGGTTVVGRVSEVFEESARVLLFSSPGVSYEGVIAGKITFSVEGQGGGSLRGEVPVGSEVAVGDHVLLAPGGYASNVSYIERVEGSSLERVYMQLPVNIQQLLYVEVWKD